MRNLSKPLAGVSIDFVLFWGVMDAPTRADPPAADAPPPDGATPDQVPVIVLESEGFVPSPGGRGFRCYSYARE